MRVELLWVGSVPFHEKLRESTLALHYMRAQQEASHVRTRMLALTRHQASWRLDLGSPSLQNCKKWISVIYKPQGLYYFCYSSQSRLRQCFFSITFYFLKSNWIIFKQNSLHKIPTSKTEESDKPKVDNLEMNLFCLLWVPWQSSWRFLGNPIIPKIESETIDRECLSFSWHTRRCLFYLLASDAKTNPLYIQVLWWLVDCWRVGATQILFTEPQQQGPEKDSWCYVQASVCQLVLLFFLTVQLIVQLSNSNSLEGEKRLSELF